MDEGHNVVNAINELYSPSITIKDIKCLEENIPLYKAKYSMKCDIGRLSTIEKLCYFLLKYFSKLNNNSNQLLRVSEFKCNSIINNINLSEINSYIRKYNVCAKMRSFLIRRSKEVSDEDRNKNEDIIVPNAMYKLIQFLESLVTADSV